MVIREEGDFNFYGHNPPSLALRHQEWRSITPGERFHRLLAAWDEVRDIHRLWFLKRNPGAQDFEILCDWSRHTGGAEILANARKDEAEKSTDQPIIVDFSR